MKPCNKGLKGLVSLCPWRCPTGKAAEQPVLLQGGLGWYWTSWLQEVLPILNYSLIVLPLGTGADLWNLYFSVL